MTTYHTLLFLPTIACFCWALVHWMLAFKESTFRTLFTLLLTAGFAMLTGSGDFLYADMHGSSAASRIALQLLTPSIIPLMILYLDHLGHDSRLHPAQLLWIVIPAVLFSAAIVLTSLINGEELKAFLSVLYSQGFSALDAYKGSQLYVYFLFTEMALRIALAAEFLFFVFFIIRKSRKEHLRYKTLFAFLKKGETGVKEIQMALGSLILVTAAVKILVPDAFFVHQEWANLIWSFILAILIFVFCYFALFSSQPTVTLEKLKSAFRFNYSAGNKADVVEAMIGNMVEEADAESLERILGRIGTVSNPESLKGAEDHPGAQQGLAAAIFSAVSKSWDDQSLMSRFQHLMLDEQLFLQSGLTLTDVADRLHSNKTYVSKMVNQTYNISFPEMLNILRIDYAEQYITSHRDANQEEIAKACGFLSASSFNSTFKRITGFTPRVWAARKNMEA